MNNELPEMKMITTILMEYDLEYKDSKVENEILHNIINKAIEYINNCKVVDKEWQIDYCIDSDIKEDLLDILKGVDKE